MEGGKTMFMLLTPEERARQSEEWLKRIIEGKEENPFGTHIIRSIQILSRLFANVSGRATNTAQVIEGAGEKEGEEDHVV